jgi:hypothetical protein
VLESLESLELAELAELVGSAAVLVLSLSAIGQPSCSVSGRGAQPAQPATGPRR